MDLAARAARTRIAHFPEVVMGIAVEDMVLRQMSLPEFCSLIVTAHTDSLIALKNGCIEVLGVQFIDIDQQIPCPIDGLVLEIVTK